MTRLIDLHKEWMKDPEYRAEYEATEPTFDLMRALMHARVHSGLTQSQIAQKMGTSQSAIARLEGWSSNPSVKTLHKYADATGTRLRIRFEPVNPDSKSPHQEEDDTSLDVAVESASVETSVTEPMPVAT